jgi:hypothetical protein
MSEEAYNPYQFDTPRQTEGRKNIANFRQFYQIKHTDRLITTKNEKITFSDMTQDVDGRKPKGLWYSCGSAWIDWLESNMPQWGGKHFFSIEINPDKMLMIDTEKKLRIFSEEYGVTDDDSSNWGQLEKVGWYEVSSKYSGIEICPYMSENNYNWYYGWDVASGCIWKKDAIKNIKRII